MWPLHHWLQLSTATAGGLCAGEVCCRHRPMRESRPCARLTAPTLCTARCHCSSHHTAGHPDAGFRASHGQHTQCAARAAHAGPSIIAANPFGVAHRLCSHVHTSRGRRGTRLAAYWCCISGPSVRRRGPQRCGVAARVGSARTHGAARTGGEHEPCVGVALVHVRCATPLHNAAEPCVRRTASGGHGDARTSWCWLCWHLHCAWPNVLRHARFATHGAASIVARPHCIRTNEPPATCPRGDGSWPSRRQPPIRGEVPRATNCGPQPTPPLGTHRAVCTHAGQPRRHTAAAVLGTDGQ